MVHKECSPVQQKIMIFILTFNFFVFFFAQQGELGNHREALKNVLSRAKFSHHAEAFIINWLNSWENSKSKRLQKRVY